MVFLTKGTFMLGMKTRDRDGNIVKDVAPMFTVSEDGGSVAVGILDDETMNPVGPAELFGDFQPWQYLSYALKLLKPKRRGNIPDFEGMIKQHAKVNGRTYCIFDDDCEAQHCQDCIVREWMDDDE